MEIDNLIINIGVEEMAYMRKRAIERRQTFFEFWKKGVELAGVKFFGDGTKENFELATKINDLAPVAQNVEGALACLSPGESAFLASLYSFFNSYKGADFCNIANVKSVGDLTVLDAESREVIAGLLVNYHGW